MPSGKKIPKEEINSFKFNDNQNFQWGFSSSSRGQAILIDGQYPPTKLDATSNAFDAYFPVKEPKGENQKACSGDRQTVDGSPQKRKRYHRHTDIQVLDLEAFFNKCPKPNAEQRKELGWKLGLDPSQVKFWFQNKRTQMKARLQREENIHYQAENEKLLAENLKLKALANSACEKCRGLPAIGGSVSTQYLRLENAKLKEEIKRISSIIMKYGGNAWTSSSIPISSLIGGSIKFGEEAIGVNANIPAGEIIGTNEIDGQPLMTDFTAKY